jgi:hypothetical protein
VKRLKRHYRERLGPNSFRERPLERFLVSFPGTGQEYSRRHYDRNYVQSDRAAEIIRDPDVAMLIKEPANHMPRNAEKVLIFVSFLNHM